MQVRSLTLYQRRWMLKRKLQFPLISQPHRLAHGVQDTSSNAERQIERDDYSLTPPHARVRVQSVSREQAGAVSFRSARIARMA
jgi:hypothetical protein